MQCGSVSTSKPRGEILSEGAFLFSHVGNIETRATMKIEEVTY